jgi:Sodium/hydrogen exchanger family
MTGVAIVAHALIGIPRAAAFALGAVVSPTDPLAAGLFMRGLDVPRRMVSLIEGEGLFNDATALVAYRVAVAAVVAGSSSLGQATVALIADAAGGIGDRACRGLDHRRGPRSRARPARAGKIEDDGYEDRSLAYQQVVQAVLAAQRDALVELRRAGTISNETMNRVIQELDLEESRLEISAVTSA